MSSSSSSSVNAKIIEHPEPSPMMIEDDDYTSGSDHDDDNADFDSDDEQMLMDFGGIGQLLITEEGEAMVDVLAGIRDALLQTNKILYKISKALLPSESSG